jgi:hypothetical protein
VVIIVVCFFVLSCFSQIKITVKASESEVVFQPMHIVESASPTNQPSANSYTPEQIKNAYGLPSSGGAGTTIAIIDAYDTTSIWNDLGTFSSEYSLPLPTSSNFKVEMLGNQPASGSNSHWALETCLDVEWAHAIAPNATILLVEAATDYSGDLLNAVQYAISQPDVVAVSMSWGNNETELGQQELFLDSSFASSSGISFFASSGDDGSAVNWPACSPYVIGVGGTILNLTTTDGTVISETAWSLSSGGVSAYEPQPSYQASYALPYSNRAVPDVSYCAENFPVCCQSSWETVGGTSAGAPQWAAICALDGSVSSANIYKAAKLNYGSYFRDITSGSNHVNSATVGYDLVTGLGSPLTDDFSYTQSASALISPTSGPPGGSITLSGTGCTANSSVSISYLNQNTWIPIASSVPTDNNQNFTIMFKAPDLLQNNQAGDNPPLSDNIIFQVTDNTTGNSFNTTVPYTEMRRGLTQIGTATANGIYGNNTDLGTSLFVQNGQSITVLGQYFYPGSALLLWDGTTILGITTIDPTGALNTTLTVPNTTAGKHSLIISDADSNFSLILTRLPSVTCNYTTGSWQTSDITIVLTPDYNVTETYYSINGGTVENVTASGQPVITTEGSNNTLEYWSTWNIYGTGTMDLPPTILTGIELETTPPQASMQINNGAVSTTSSDVTLTFNVTDSVSGAAQMRFSDDDTWNQSVWQPYMGTAIWSLTSGEGVKTIYCEIQDNAGLETTTNATIYLNTAQPASSPSPQTATPTPSATPTQMSSSPTSPSSSSSSPSPSSSPTTTQTQTTNSSPSVTPTVSSAPQNSTTPQIPELTTMMILIIFAVTTALFSVTVSKKRAKINSAKNS